MAAADEVYIIPIAQIAHTLEDFKLIDLYQTSTEE